MIRTTPDDIKSIMDGLTASDPIIETFIISASAIVDKVFAGDTSIGDTLRKEIERWLTAHFIASTIHRMADDEKLGEAEVKYFGKAGLSLDGTPYGQTAKAIDITGKLCNLGTGNATVYAITSFK
jgi:hypothetical protein